MSAGLSARPSFFEVYAAEQLNSTLRPAFRYVLEVLSLRNPSLVKLASWSDEIFSGLLLVLESSQLRRDSALLSESFYSLRRSTRKSFESKTIDLPLSTHHVLGSILYAIIIPHIRTKLDAWYATRTGGAAAAMLQDTQNTRHPTYSSQVSSTSSQNRSRPRALRLALDTPILSKKRLRTAVLILIRLPQIATSLCRRLVRYLKSEAFSRLLMFYYPMIRAVTDGINMMFGALYLYGHSRYYNLSLALQGLILRRVNDTDLLDFSSILSNSSSDASNNASDLITNILGRIVSVLRIAFFTSIFGFRFLQYYYAAEAAAPRNTGSTMPPPDPLEPARGVDRELAMAPGKCPICHQERTNPTACTTSGYVFCYLCIVSHLQQTKKCPVTLAPATVNDLVRVYDNAGGS